MTNKDIGRIGLSMAINYFTVNAYTVSIPMNDTQGYDLIIEKDGIFKTVQCKATQTENGEISLKSTGGTKGTVYDSVINHSELDYLFAVNKDFDCWLIPVSDIIDKGVKNQIALRTSYAPSAVPKLDTTIYRVQISNKA